MAACIVKLIVCVTVLYICMAIVLSSLLRTLSDTQIDNRNEHHHSVIANSTLLPSTLQNSKSVEIGVKIHLAGSDEMINLGDSDSISSTAFKSSLSNTRDSDSIPDVAFKSSLSHTQRDQLLEMLGVFSQVMQSNNVRYFMYSGTLLGSWRHHGFIPWDDDVDVIVDGRQKRKLKVITRINCSLLKMCVYLMDSYIVQFKFNHKHT